MDPYALEPASSLALRAVLGGSYGVHRQPRVRLVDGTRGGYWCILSTFRTKRAAFRWARRLRDHGGMAHPLRVFPRGRSRYVARAK